MTYTPFVNVLDLTHLEEHFSRMEEPPDAVPTPFPSWNEHCGDAGGRVGLAMGWHVIVAGRTGHGKSLLSLNLAAKALMEKWAVGFVSLEMSVEQITTRLMAILTGLPVKDLERGEGFRPYSVEKAMEFANDQGIYKGMRFYVNPEPLRSLLDIHNLMTVWHEEHRVRFFIVDYLQLVGGYGEDLYREVTEISHAIRGFAVQRNVLTLGLSQLNRQVSSSQDQPIVQGLIGSSSLENDADQVMLLDHSYFERDPKLTYLARTFLLNAKNRHGGTGSIPIEWDYNSLRAREPEKGSLERRQWPN